MVVLLISVVEQSFVVPQYSSALAFVLCVVPPLGQVPSLYSNTVVVVL